MSKSKAEVRLRDPQLPLVLAEIVASLELDDWCRWVNNEGKRSYYIVGFTAHMAHISGDEEYPISEFPKPSPPSPLSESFVRSQMPLQQPDYLRRARLRLERAGVGSAAIDQFLAGDLNWDEWRFNDSTPREERIKLWSDFMQAVRVCSDPSEVLQLDEEEGRDADTAREKLCLHEISDKYAKIVQRWAPLDALGFHDPLLEEASRAFVYGFYRATVVLSAAALEDRLKILTDMEWLSSYNELVDTAKAQGFLDFDSARFAKHVFGKRKEAVHEHASVTPEIAKESFFITRKLIGDLPRPV
jgi:hypothetical protein